MEGSSGSLTGYFNYDPATNTLGNYDITSSSGDEYSFEGGATDNGYTYDNGDVTSAFVGSGNAEYIAGLDIDDPVLYLIYDDMAGSGTFNVDYFAEGTTYFVGANTGVAYNRAGNGGTLIGTPAVPELLPLATIGFMSFLGSGALCRAAVKRRRVSSAVV